jgi:hypothetical protein
MLSWSTVAHAQFGVAVGANFDRLSDAGGGISASFENASGFHIGVFYDLPLGPVAVRPGIYYMDIGGLDATAEDGSLIGSFDMTMIEVPIDARVRMMTPFLKPYGTLGPVLRFARSDDDRFDEALNNFTVAANVGLGVEIGATGAQVRLFPEIRYSFGVSRIAESVTFLGQQFSAEQDLRLNTFMIRLGISF